MPNALTNTNISATYKGVLHADGEPIPDLGLKPVYDGTGVQSALSIARSNQGATVSGLLSTNDLRVGQLKMPNIDGSENQVVARTSTGVLELKSLSDIIGGSTITPGVYDNPRITVGAGGVITKIESRPTIQLLGTRVNLIPYADYDAVDFTNIFNINWVNQTGYYADAPTNTISPRYAIITVKMYLESLAANFDTRLTIDDVEIAQGAIGNNDTDNYVYLDRNKYIYMDQVIVNIPSSKTSIFKFIRNLTLVRINGRYNKCGFGVTLDGWVF
jgi:hypothetical protein